MMVSVTAPTVLFWQKLKTLPRVIEEYQRSKVWYERIKERHQTIAKACSITETMILFTLNILTIVMCSDILQPLISSVLQHVRIFDEFLCHQLDFLEQSLSKVDTEWVYKSNGIIDKLYLSTCLSLRLMFLLPRLAFTMFGVCFDVIVGESVENLNLFMAIVTPQTPRRSRRVKSKGSKVKKVSPGKKRKHEDIDSTLPDYFYVHEYSQDSDPDFIPNSDNDTEVTSASEHSYDDDSGDEPIEIGESEATIELPQVKVIVESLPEIKVNDALESKPEVLAG